MNRRRYSKSNYRKRRIRNIIIISVAIIAILFVVFMAVGLSMAEKTKEYEVPEDDFDIKETDGSVLREVKAVSAYPLPLLEDGSSFSSRLNSIYEGASDVCIALNKPDGTLQYRSSLASNLSYLSVESDASSLSGYLKSLSSDDLYVTATLYIPTFKENDDELLADVELSIWGSVACEAIRAGVGDVLIIAHSASEEELEKLCALADRIHVTEESAIIGLALPNSAIISEKSASVIDKLSKKFDYLALDLIESEGGSDILEYAEQAISDMQLQLIYYKMRILLPRAASAEELASLIEIAKKYNVTSWQSTPY